MEKDVWEAIKNLVEQEDEARRIARGVKGPRSRLVEAVLVMLLARPMRAAEIAGVLGYETRYVSSYLSYWKTRGYVEYESGYWYLTPLGEEFARNVFEREVNSKFNEFANIAQRIISSYNIKDTVKRKKSSSGRPERSGILQFTAGLNVKSGNERLERGSKASCVLESLSSELLQEELEVLRALMDHYVKWGTTYMYLDQLQEALEADFQWLVRILRELQTKGILYIYKDPRLGLRIGFSKMVKELLENCVETD